MAGKKAFDQIRWMCIFIYVVSQLIHTGASLNQNKEFKVPSNTES